MTHLTREALDAWADNGRAIGFVGVVTLRLEEGDSTVTSNGMNPPMELTITGPAIVELVVYRAGGWSARELVYETPESIALAASLAQREPPCAGYVYSDHRAELCRDASHAHGDQTYTWQSQTLPAPRVYRDGRWEVEE